MKSASGYPTIHIWTSVSAICVAAGLALWPSIYPEAGAVFGIAAFFMTMKEVSAYTSPYQFVMAYLAALVSGLACDSITFPVVTLALLFCTTGVIGRMLFFRYVGYTQHTWLEPLFLVLAVGVWIGGNLAFPHGWMAWAVPVPFFVFQGIMAMGILKDKMQLLSFTKGGYRIAIGAEAPDFTLPDQEGAMTELSSFRNERHLLLVFVRGDWCPGCHMMLRTYQKEAARFRTKNIFAMAIGPDPVGVNREMVEKLGLDFKVLSDERQKTAMVYGVQLNKYDNDFAEKYEEGIPLPASFLIDKKGIVRYVSRPDKVGEFLDPRTIFPIIDGLS
ncbi:MAG: redoxin domain-containing protein [Bacteroidia bacterium]